MLFYGDRALVLDISAEELLLELSKHKIWIYGAGYVGRQFHDVLKEKGYLERIKGFIVSRESCDCAQTNVWLLENAEIQREDLICVAVHEASKDEIVQTLKQRGYCNYIWIYPILYELIYGKSVKSGFWMPVTKIMPCKEELFGIAIRWAALEEYYGKNDWGFRLYRQVMKECCTQETIEARVEGYKRLIFNWEKKGYDENSQISINRNNEIIDGEHRVTLAVYHKQRMIKCRMYNGERVLTSEKQLRRLGFQEDDIQKLHTIVKYINKTISNWENYK